MGRAGWLRGAVVGKVRVLPRKGYRARVDGGRESAKGRVARAVEGRCGRPSLIPGPSPSSPRERVAAGRGEGEEVAALAVEDFQVSPTEAAAPAS